MLDRAACDAGAFLPSSIARATVRSRVQPAPREGLVLASKSFEGNPYDGHTLAATVDQAVEIGGVDPDRIYVDKGYRGHD